MNVNQREVANGIVHFRKLSEFLFGIKCDQGFLCSFDGPFDAILKIQGIVDILDIDSVYPVNRQRAIYPRTIFLLENGTFYETKVSGDLIFDLSNEWDSFRRLQPESKELIMEALREIGRPSMLVRYRSEHIEDYVDRIRRRESDGEEG